MGAGYFFIFLTISTIKPITWTSKMPNVNAINLNSHSKPFEKYHIAYIWPVGYTVVA